VPLPLPILPDLPLLDLAACGWFLACWLGYTYWADHRDKPGLAATMLDYRRLWTRGMLARENRMVDVMIIGHLMNSMSFFASTSLVVVGGLAAVLGSRVEAMKVLRELPFVPETAPLLWDLKVLLLVIVFVYAFFKFTWAFRHYNYCLILLGTVPNPDRVEPAHGEIAERLALIATSTGKHFNRGVRAYYFGLGALSWFIHPLLFIAVSAAVVLILERREFRSRLLATLGDPTQLPPGPTPG
jgi:uncharacterized membrane protein